jgi:transcriptional regulator with XRE-family HTH domain
MDRVTIGHALGERRRYLALDQGTAATRIGISRSTYAAYEHGGRRPSIDVLRSLAAFLDVTLDEVLELYGATCIVLARLALMRDMLTDGESTSTLSDAAGEVADAAAAIVAEAASTDAAVVDVSSRRMSRDDDMSVVKRVYFDVVTGSDHRPTRSYAVLTSDGPGALRRSVPAAAVAGASEASASGDVVSIGLLGDHGEESSKKKGEAKKRKKKSAGKGGKKRPKNKDKGKPKDDDGKKRKKKRRKDRH